MFETKLERQRSEIMRPEQLGEDWIKAIQAKDFDRVAQFCTPRATIRMLLPGGLVSYSNASDVVNKYREWFGDYSEVRVEASRVSRVERRLGIFYRLLLRDHGDAERIEQQLYCILKDGRVAQLHLVCSGFQSVESDKEVSMLEMRQDGQPDPIRDGLLELHSEEPDTAATCAVLTPMIRERLDGMRSGQILEVRVNDPLARGDVEAWSRLSGNPLLKMVDDGGEMLRFYVKKK
jgi:TusA-related sulfurtransferase